MTKALLKACQRGDLEFVAARLAEDPACVHSADGSRACCLHRAARQGHTDVVRLLLEHKGNPNTADDKWVTPLHEACSNGHADAVAALLDAGAALDLAKANSSIRNGGFEPIHFATSSGDLATVQLLLERGATPMGNPTAVEPPLHVAARDGWVEGARLLLRCKAAVEYRSPAMGRSALHVAVMHGRDELVAELVSAGAEVAAADFSGQQPIHFAAAQAVDCATLAVLAAAGADLGALDNQGRPPRAFAAAEGNTVAMAWLHEQGAPEWGNQRAEEAEAAAWGNLDERAALEVAMRDLVPDCTLLRERCDTDGAKAEP